MFWLVTIICFILMIIGLVRSWEEAQDRYSNKKMLRVDFDCGGGVLFWVIVFVLFIHMLLFVCFYADNASDIAAMDAFYNASVANYEYTIDKTASYLSIDEETLNKCLVDGSVEKFKLADSVSLRIAEYRDELNEYNDTLARLRKFKNMWFTSTYIPEVPEHLQYIILK